MSEREVARHNLHWLPNALTVSRILLIPVLALAIYLSDMSEDEKSLWAAYVAFSLFIYCALTDYLDGFFARKWSVTSDFGRMLDPIADKLFVAACLISFSVITIGEPLLYVPMFIIIGRDISISGVREYAALASKVMAPTKLAKWKTAFEMLSIFLILLWIVIAKSDLTTAIIFINIPNEGGVPYAILLQLGVTMLWLAAILSAYTGFHYFRSAMRKPE